MPWSKSVIAIEVDDLSKSFSIGASRNGSYCTLRESIMDAFAAPSRRLNQLMTSGRVARKTNDVWALQNVSFEVRSGEALGIIGRNGAGKSTLLKILSNITPPTDGQISLRGRVG